MNKLKIDCITDSKVARTVRASVRYGQLSGVLTLWTGDAYDNVGDWTQAQAEARINECVAQLIEG
jgi:hypothetical protein